MLNHLDIMANICWTWYSKATYDSDENDERKNNCF
jgi:hypothetical protein